MKNFILLAAALCLFVLPSICQVAPSFYGAKSPSSFNSYPGAIKLKATSDLNNDGHLDLIGCDDNYVKILYLDGAGSMIADTLYYISLNSVRDCDTADLNHDGYEDVVGCAHGGWGPEDEVFVLMSDTLGRLSMTFITGINGSEAYEITLNDFDNDGFMDAAVATGMNSAVAVLYGDSAQTFPDIYYPILNLLWHGTYIASGDFNNDTLDDIVLTYGVSIQFAVLVATSIRGAFQVTTHTGTGTFAGVKCADLNLDGTLDLIFAGTQGPTDDHGANVYYGLPNGTFTVNFSAFFLNGGPMQPVREVYIQHMNGDALPDAVLTGDDGAIHTYLNSGSGVLTHMQRGVGGFNPLLADFDADGDIDLYANTGRNTYRYIYAWGDGSGLLPLSPRYPEDRNWKIETADFNNDGYGDILSFKETTSEIALSVGSASNGLIPSWSTSALIGPYVTINDFNGDNNKDFATYMAHLSRIKIFYGDGNGGFSADSISVTGGNNVFDGSISSADFNLDGNVDLVYGYEHGNYSEWGLVLNLGSSGFAAPVVTPISTSLQLSILEAGLINTDNYPDIIIRHTQTSSFSVLYGNGNATFAAAQMTTTQAAWCADIQIVHMDYDAYPDICFGTLQSMVIHYGNSSGTFSAPQVRSGCNSRNVPCVDLNGDWMTDYVTLDDDANLFSIVLGDGNRNYTYSDTAYPSCTTNSYDLCATDVDNDGRIDLVDSRLVVLRNITPGAIITEAPVTGTPDPSGFNISLYPNPAAGETNLIVHAEESSTAQVTILTTDGRIVNTTQTPVQSGDTRVPLQVSDLATGMYFVEVKVGSESQTKRLLIGD